MLTRPGRILLTSLIGGLALVITITYLYKTRKFKSSFSHDEVARINPTLIVDKITLVHKGAFQAAMEQAVLKLADKGILIPTPFGMVMNPDLAGKDYSISLIIESGGGFVSLGNTMVGMLNELRKNGIKTKCYIGEAQSMAFTIMVLGCDKVIAKKSATIMQHRTSYGSSGQTPSTYALDIEIARAEAQALKVNYEHWLSLTKGEDNHVFTKEEIKKYKLVDEWI